MKRKILSIVLSLAMALTIMPAMGVATYAASRDVTVVLPDGGGTFIVQDPEVAAEGDTDWGTDGNESWLYVASDIDNTGKDIVVHGDVKLILGDNTTYRCRSLALSGSTSNITFYCESYGDSMGTFIADNSSNPVNAAAIGTNIDVNSLGGNITIYGGNIQAISYGDYNAALGCGTGIPDTWTAMGTITINGGNIIAEAKKNDDYSGAAIGTAWQGSLENIIINGGNVNAETTGSMAAIGGACFSYSGFGTGTIELNGGNITAYTAGTGSNPIKAIGGYEGYESKWTITSVQEGKTVPINSCYWYMIGGSSKSDANDIHELGDNKYVKISKKSEVQHAYMERFPVVQPEFDEAGTLVNAGCKAYFKCACGNYYEDNAECKYIGNTEEELNAWKAGAGRLEEKYIAEYLSYENGEMKAKSQDVFYNLSYDGASILGTIGTTTWYYIDGNVEFKHNIEVRGDVRIILADDITAGFYHGLNMYKKGSSLTVYAQSEGSSMGKLIAGGCSDSGAACIGGFGTSGAKIRIDGGDITAENAGTRVGIGDGDYPEGNPAITINGGKIKARGHGGPAIGYDTAEHGWNNRSCTVTINGGTIDAVSYEGNAAAIGSAGCYQTGLTINGGNITALSNGDGVAIGCSPVAWYKCTPTIRYCLFDTVAGESAETAEKCDYSDQRYVKMTRLAEPVTHRLKKEYPMWAPRFNGDNTLAEAGCRAYYQCMCGYYYSDSEMTKRISNLETWKNDSSINGGKLDHAIIAGEEPTCSAPGYKEYYAKGKLYFSDEECTQSIDNIRSWKSKGGSGYIAPLGHVFTEYSAEGNVLTGICSQPDCELADHKATLTLKGEEFDRDGNPKSPAIVNDGWTAEIPEITYEGTGETEWSGTEAPTEIGTYAAYITAGDATASQEFTIVENSAISELLKKLEEAKARYEDAEGRVTELEGELEQAETEYSRMKNDYEQQLAAKAQEIGGLEQSLKEAKARYEDAEGRVTELEGELEQAKIEYSRMKNDYEQQLAAKAQEIEGLENNLQQAFEEKANAEKRAEEAEAKLKLCLVDSKLFDLASSRFGSSIKSLDLTEFVVGGQKPYVFSGKGLPSGIEVSAEGILSGKYNEVTPAGTASITVTDAAGNSSTITINYGKVDPAPVSGRTAVLSATKYVYSGTAKKPTVKISGLVPDTDYTVAYKNNTMVGKATVTITGNGNYTDTITKTFKINPKKASVLKLTPGVEKLTVKASSKPSAKGAAMYQIAYKQKGTSKWKYTTTKYQSKAIKKLKKGKRYYVKVRAYKTVSKVKYYGAWSETKLSKKIK